MQEKLTDITIVPLSSAFKDQAAHLFAIAYARDPVISNLMANTSDARRLKILAFYWKLQLSHCLAYGHPIALLKNGNLVGAKLLYLPLQYPIPAHAQWISLFKMIVYFLICRMTISIIRRLIVITKKVEALHPDNPHLYDELTCIAPEFQGKGLYTLLQQYMINLSDEHKAGIYCETSNPMNIPRLVKRFGFQIINEIKAADISYWSLWRQHNMS